MLGGAEQICPACFSILFSRNQIARAVAVLLSGTVSFAATEASGILEGHLKILQLKGVELAQGDAPAVTRTTYSEYPLIIRSRRGEKEVARATADANGK